MNTIRLIFMDGRTTDVVLDDFATQDFLHCFFSYRSGESEFTLFESSSNETGLVNLIIDMQPIVGINVIEDNRDPNEAQQMTGQLQKDKVKQ